MFVFISYEPACKATSFFPIRLCGEKKLRKFRKSYKALIKIQRRRRKTITSHKIVILSGKEECYIIDY